MRGRPEEQTSMVMLMTLESRVPKDHPIRRIKALADEALRALSPPFDEMYRDGGRPSVPPERLLKATLLITLYSVRSERQFCEQLDYNLLYRWFLDMNMEETSFVPTVFTKNRERLLTHEVGARFLQEVVRQARKARLMSNEHFSADGTLIEAWASMKSFRPKDEDEDDQRRSAVDARTTRHPGYEVSQRIRRRIESIFGWMKTTGVFDRTRFRGIARTQLAAHFVGAAYNLVRMARLLAA